VKKEEGRKLPPFFCCASRDAPAGNTCTVLLKSFLPTRSVSLLLFRLQFMAQCSVDTVGAIIDRPARKFYEFALGFGKYETFPCAGAQ